MSKNNTVPREPVVVDRYAHGHNVPVVRSQSPARTPDSRDAEIGAPAIPTGSRPTKIGTTQAGSVEVWQQSEDMHTPTNADVERLIASAPPGIQAPAARDATVRSAYGQAARDVAPVVAAAFHSGARIDAGAVNNAFDAAFRGRK